MSQIVKFTHIIILSIFNMLTNLERMIYMEFENDRFPVVDVEGVISSGKQFDIDKRCLR